MDSQTTEVQRSEYMDMPPAPAVSQTTLMDDFDTNTPPLTATPQVKPAPAAQALEMQAPAFNRSTFTPSRLNRHYAQGEGTNRAGISALHRQLLSPGTDRVEVLPDDQPQGSALGRPSTRRARMDDRSSASDVAVKRESPTRPSSSRILCFIPCLGYAAHAIVHRFP
jgi:hypothetical protein